MFTPLSGSFISLLLPILLPLDSLSSLDLDGPASGSVWTDRETVLALWLLEQQGLLPSVVDLREELFEDEESCDLGTAGFPLLPCDPVGESLWPSGTFLDECRW